MRLVALAVTLIALVAEPHVIVAQARPSVEGGEIFRHQIQFERFNPTAEQQRALATAQTTSFASATFVIDLSPACEGMMNSARATATVMIEIERPGTVEWWKLPAGAPSAGATSRRTIPDPCGDDDAANWLLVNAAEHPVEISQVSQTLPIFLLAYETDWVTMHGGNRADHVLVVDLRGPVPMLTARLSSFVIDSTCAFAAERPRAVCAWDDSQSDFLCAESYAGARRYSRLLNGTRLDRLPGAAPHMLEQFDAAVGAWAELDDAGAVRLIAEVPGRGPRRRLRLFGTRPDLGAPFTLQIIDNGQRTTVPVANQSAEPFVPSPLTETIVWDQPIPLAEYRLTGEPPSFRVRPLTRDGNVQLLRVVSDESSTGIRTVYHLAIEDAGDKVMAQAIKVVRSTIPNGLSPDQEFDINEPVDACVPQFGGFAAPTRIRPAPLRIDYDVEAPFLTGQRDEPRRPEQCVVGSHAVWQTGKGFTISFDRAACSQTVFRMERVDPDGVITTRTLRER